MDTLEFFIGLDSDGNWHVSSDESDVSENMTEGYPWRLVRLEVKMRRPEMLEARTTIADDAGTEVHAAAAGA